MIVGVDLGFGKQGTLTQYVLRSRSQYFFLPLRDHYDEVQSEISHLPWD
jgi:hypothetical protein